MPRTTSVNSLEALTLPVLLKKLSKRNSIRPPTTLSSRLLPIPASKLVFSRSLCLTPALGLPQSPLKVLACTCYLLSSKLLSDTALVFLCSRLLVGAPRVRLAFWTSSGTTLSLVGEWWPDLPSRQTTGHYFQCYLGCLFSPHKGATEPHPWRTVQTRRYFYPYLERWSPSCFRRHRDIPAAVISSLSCGGDPLEVAEDRKFSKHEKNCEEQGISFFPLAVETLGGWSALAIKTLKSVAILADARRSGSRDARVAPVRLLQSLSVCLMRGNATMIVIRAI